MPQSVRAFLADESGAASVEYGLLVAGIAVAIVTSVNATGCSLTGVFNRIGNNISAAG